MGTLYAHFLEVLAIWTELLYSPVYTGPPTGSGLESGLRPRNAGGPGDLDRNLDQLHLHGAESGNGSRKVVSCKRGLCGFSMDPSSDLSQVNFDLQIWQGKYFFAEMSTTNIR